MLWLLGSWLHISAWVSPCVMQWRTEWRVTSACGARGGASAPPRAQCRWASLLSASSSEGSGVWRDRSIWRSSSAWPAAPLWLTTCRWWQEPQGCLSLRNNSINTLLLLLCHENKSSKRAQTSILDYWSKCPLQSYSINHPKSGCVFRVDDSKFFFFLVENNFVLYCSF